MKTLGFAVGLLLLFTVSYCTDIPEAVNDITPPRCCFKFFTGRIPQRSIISIIKTHSKCLERGFVVRTTNGNELCVSENLNWAQEAFRQQNQEY